MKQKNLDYAKKVASGCSEVADFSTIPLAVMYVGVLCATHFEKLQPMTEVALCVLTIWHLGQFIFLPVLQQFATKQYLKAYGEYTPLEKFSLAVIGPGLLGVLLAALISFGQIWAVYLYAIALVVDAFCVGAVLGFSLYWRALSKRKPSEVEMVDDFLKNVTPESVPAGMAMRLNLRTGEIRTYPIDFDFEAMLNDPSTVVLSRRAIKTTSETDTETAIDEHQNA